MRKRLTIKTKRDVRVLVFGATDKVTESYINHEKVDNMKGLDFNSVLKMCVNDVEERRILSFEMDVLFA